MGAAAGAVGVGQAVPAKQCSCNLFCILRARQIGQLGRWE
jgi:hypothetical protein